MAAYAICPYAFRFTSLSIAAQSISGCMRAPSRNEHWPKFAACVPSVLVADWDPLGSVDGFPSPGTKLSGSKLICAINVSCTLDLTAYSGLTSVCRSGGIAPSMPSKDNSFSNKEALKGPILSGGDPARTHTWASNLSRCTMFYTFTTSCMNSTDMPLSRCSAAILPALDPSRPRPLTRAVKVYMRPELHDSGYGRTS